MDSYKTISLPSQGEYKEKGSKFISFAYPVTQESQINEIVQSLKKEYYDARHHCYAWRLNAEGDVFRMVDDGEPSSTAGKPIYGQILTNELTYILIVVVRYFGGTKLGVSGLIQAYKEAAADAIAQSEIIVKNVDIYYVISFPYVEINSVMKIVKEMSVDVQSQCFDNRCVMEVSIRKCDNEQFIIRITGVNGATIDQNEV